MDVDTQAYFTSATINITVQICGISKKWDFSANKYSYSSYYKKYKQNFQLFFPNCHTMDHILNTKICLQICKVNLH